MEKINVGVDLGGSHVSIGVVNNKGIIIKQLEKDYTVDEKKDILNVAINYITFAIDELKKEFEFNSFGLGMAGIIKNGIIMRSPNIDGAKNFEIKKFLEEKTNMSVNVENDAICAAIAEYEFGHIKDFKNIIFLTLGTGIGGNIIYNGKIRDEEQYQELGHTIIKENGIKCKCGQNGCFERYGSILVFKKKVMERLNLPQNLDGPTLREHIRLNEDKIEDIKEEYINDIVLGLSILIKKFNPDLIVLGGGFARYDYLFLDKIKDKLNENVHIKVAELGNDAGIIGASIL